MCFHLTMPTHYKTCLRKRGVFGNGKWRGCLRPPAGHFHTANMMNTFMISCACTFIRVCDVLKNTMIGLEPVSVIGLRCLGKGIAHQQHVYSLSGPRFANLPGPACPIHTALPTVYVSLPPPTDSRALESVNFHVLLEHQRCR